MESFDQSERGVRLRIEIHQTGDESPREGASSRKEEGDVEGVILRQSGSLTDTPQMRKGTTWSRVITLQLWRPTVGDVAATVRLSKGRLAGSSQWLLLPTLLKPAIGGVSNYRAGTHETPTGEELREALVQAVKLLVWSCQDRAGRQ